MAHQGRNGHHDESYADMASFPYGQVPFNYQQRQAFSPHTVLSQNDTNFMEEFFANPDTTSASESFLPLGMDGKFDFNSMVNNGNVNNEVGMNNENTIAPPATTLPDASPGNFENHMARQSRPQFASIDFSEVFLGGHPQPSIQSGGDAVAGASALMGLSTSHDPSNPLSANNYASWGNIVATSTVHNSNNTNNSSTGNNPSAAARPQSLKPANSPQAQMNLQPSNSQPVQWMNTQNQQVQPRTRHSSLTLDTYNTQMPNHQQLWQQVPQSALPQPNSRSRPPPAFRFGSDERFSTHGFTGPPSALHEEKQNNLMFMPFAEQLANSAQQQSQQQQKSQTRGFRPVNQLQGLTRHSLPNALLGMGSGTSSPGGIGGLPATANHTVDGWSPLQQQQQQQQQGQTQNDSHSRKRRASQIGDGVVVTKVEDDEEPQTSATAYKRRRSNAPQPTLSSHSQSPASSVASPRSGNASLPLAARARRAARESKQPRQNLTDAQKRSNHIASEQKRRDAMKINFDELNRLVPSLHLGSSGLSRSEILQHAAIYLEELQAGNAVIARWIGVNLDDIDREIDEEEAATIAEDADE